MYHLLIIIAQAILCKGSLLELNPAVNFTCNLQNLPCLDQHEWWGPYHLKEHHDTSIRPFRIQFDEEMIYDLRYRLKHHRSFTLPLEGISFQYGFNTRALQDLVSYWAEEYPFEERESFLNKYPMYKTNIQGLDIHFLWVQSKSSSKKDVVPVLMMHGWPGSVREFYGAIPLLTAVEKTRDFVLELIIPSLPGFGYSDSAVRPGLGSGQTAVIMRNLMHRLGYSQFYVQGGDLGGITGMYLATLYPHEVLGFHKNGPSIINPTAVLMQVFGAIYPPLVVDPALAYRMYPLYEITRVLLRETGYLHEQATKPDTIGVPLTDSPSGLMAYNLEKFNFGLGTKFSEYDLDTVPRDSLIDHLMMYWAPRSITTAMRFYAETFNRRHYGLGLDIIPCKVPTWTIQPENEPLYESPPLLKVKFPYLVNDTAIHYGGHFLAFETPKTYADDVLRAIGVFRKLRKNGVTITTSLQQEDWSISWPQLFQVLLKLYRHPEAWWVRYLLVFVCDAVTRILKRVFKYSTLSSLVGEVISY